MKKGFLEKLKTVSETKLWGMFLAINMVMTFGFVTGEIVSLFLTDGKDVRTMLCFFGCVSTELCIYALLRLRRSEEKDEEGGD